MSANRPNLLVFMVDQWRYDAAGHAGNSVCRTPNLDRLAAEGVRLTNAFTAVPLCTPTRASLWTGLWPTHHGVLINTHWRSPAGGPQNGRLPDGIPTLGTALRDAGYATSYFGKWHVGPESDLPRCGFDYSPPRGAYAKSLKERGIERRVWDSIKRDYIVADYTFAGITSLDGEDFHETWLCSRAAEWILGHLEHRPDAAAGVRPFACVVSLPGPHPGYTVPERYAALYDPRDMPLWPNTHDSLEGKPSPQRLFRDVVTQSGTITDDEWRTCIARYYAFCTLIDEQLGRLLHLLETSGVSDNTLVLFITDHGDLIGAHGLWDKGPFLYEEQIHIPIVARLPGVLPADTTCHAFTSFVDVMPTLLDGVGVPWPAPQDQSGAVRWVADGRSAWNLWRGEAAPADWPDDAYVQYHGEGITLYSIRALRTARWKYTYYPFDRDELYDLDADPWELLNLIDAPASRPALEEMRARLIKRMEQADDVLREWNVDLTPMRRRWKPG